jgi:hypothetical protein
VCVRVERRSARQWSAAVKPKLRLFQFVCAGAKFRRVHF